MSWKRRVSGGFLAAVGYLLSPLSWWNDLVVNFPLAYVFAWIVSVPYRPAFGLAFIVGYWLTNVLGFLLMHKGGQKLVTGQSKPYSRRELAIDVLVSLAYTALIVVLLALRILKPPAG